MSSSALTPISNSAKGKGTLSSSCKTPRKSIKSRTTRTTRSARRNLAVDFYCTTPKDQCFAIQGPSMRPPSLRYQQGDCLLAVVSELDLPILPDIMPESPRGVAQLPRLSRKISRRAKLAPRRDLFQVRGKTKAQHL